MPSRDVLALPASAAIPAGNVGVYARSAGTVEYSLAAGGVVRRTVAAGWSDRRSVVAISEGTADLRVLVTADQRTRQFPRVTRHTHIVGMDGTKLRSLAGEYLIGVQ